MTYLNEDLIFVYEIWLDKRRELLRTLQKPMGAYFYGDLNRTYRERIFNYTKSKDKLYLLSELKKYWIKDIRWFNSIDYYVIKYKLGSTKEQLEEEMIKHYKTQD